MVTWDLNEALLPLSWWIVTAELYKCKVVPTVQLWHCRYHSTTVCVTCVCKNCIIVFSSLLTIQYTAIQCDARFTTHYTSITQSGSKSLYRNLLYSVIWKVLIIFLITICVSRYTTHTRGEESRLQGDEIYEWMTCPERVPQLTAIFAVRHAVAFCTCIASHVGHPVLKTETDSLSGGVSGWATYDINDSIPFYYY